jgi:hypothetical protein
VLNFPDPSAPESKEAVIELLSTKYFPQTTMFGDDLESAFSLWDAVYAGVEKHSDLFANSDRKVWLEANKWLADLR